MLGGPTAQCLALCAEDCCGWWEWWRSGEVVGDGVGGAERDGRVSLFDYVFPPGNKNEGSDSIRHAPTASATKSEASEAAMSLHCAGLLSVAFVGLGLFLGL